MKKNSEIRVRFAPSPTGELHIGSLRTALYDWIYARQNKGKFILRIEDTDQSRFVVGAESRLIDSLEKTGLSADEGPEIGGEFGPYHQSERLNIYHKYAEQLLKEEKAYQCNCTEERLEKMRQDQKSRGEAPHYDGKCRINIGKSEIKKDKVIRLKTPDQGTSKINDFIRGEIEFKNELVEDFIILKTDNYPTYHFAVVIDDHFMQISHVFRGEEWISSLPKHYLLFKSFDWPVPIFVHLPLILGSDKKKLSKRHGAMAVNEFLEKGYLPQALINYIALLGWHPKNDQEFFSLEQLIKEFKVKDIQKSPAIFSIEKLNWMNAKYLRESTDKDLEKYLAGRIDRDFKKTEAKLAIKAIPLVKDRLINLDEFVELASFAKENIEYPSELLAYKKGTIWETANALRFSLELIKNNTGDFNAGALERYFHDEIKRADKENGQILWPLRVALTGKKNSPGTFDVLALLGKEKANQRINQAIEKLS